MTIKEKIPNPQGKKFVLTWSYHPKALPMAVPNSQILAGVDLGMDVTVAYPEGWDLDPGIMNEIQERAELSGSKLTFTNDQEGALKDADVIAVKSWGSLKYWGDDAKEKEAKKGLESWMFDADMMKLAPSGYIMHCLPVRRNVEVADEALDSSNSLIIDEAENRMWAQMSLINTILENK
jgi:N-acetylornithine carbamoyltransferase